MTTPEIVTLLSAIGALALAIIALVKTPGEIVKQKADVSSSSVLAASEIIDDLREDNRRLRDCMVELERKMEKLEADSEAKISRLEKEILEWRIKAEQAYERITALESELEMRNNV